MDRPQSASAAAAPTSAPTSGGPSLMTPAPPTMITTSQGEPLLERIDRAWQQVSEQFAQLLEAEGLASDLPSETLLESSTLSPELTRSQAIAKAGATLPEPPPLSARTLTPNPPRHSRRAERAWSELLEEIDGWKRSVNTSSVSPSSITQGAATRLPQSRTASSTPQLSIVLPILDRSLDVDSTIRDLLSAFDRSEIIVVMPAGRPRNFSHHWIEREPSVHELDLLRGVGWGAAVRVGMLQSVGETIVIGPARWPLTVPMVHQLLEPLNRGVADVTTLSQFARDGLPMSEKGAWRERWGEASFSWALEQLTELELTHAIGSAKALRRDQFQALKLKSRGDGFVAEMLTSLHANRARITELPEPVAFAERHARRFMTGRLLAASLLALLRRRLVGR